MEPERHDADLAAAKPKRARPCYGYARYLANERPLFIIASLRAFYFISKGRRRYIKKGYRWVAWP